ncbi:hypothetical protein BAE36_14775 [Rhizobium leguminosarum bv. trifolii]|jgi:hypothetical protein|uniref:Lactate dehydrogenase n=1 Tax=Rhizobium leguminosarum bv. trifolii TaxID=386 RepID=A0A1B8RCH8_RHILT|nr:lactate dehydrogenase [Rhizobium leguminosarum bv. trifolii]OBY06433.1 hypothetical protein BAE36_14775 [Rhizobium leguminosarum bv. trifolii]
MKEILTLVQLQQEYEIVIASIGGFELVYDGKRFGKSDGYRYTTMLQRTGADYEIDLAVTVTPLGAVFRLEHALDDFDGSGNAIASGWRKRAGVLLPTSPVRVAILPSRVSWPKSVASSGRLRPSSQPRPAKQVPLPGRQPDFGSSAAYA